MKLLIRSSSEYYACHDSMSWSQLLTIPPHTIRHTTEFLFCSFGARDYWIVEKPFVTHCHGHSQICFRPAASTNLCMDRGVVKMICPVNVVDLVGFLKALEKIPASLVSSAVEAWMVCYYCPIVSSLLLRTQLVY